MTTVLVILLAKNQLAMSHRDEDAQTQTFKAHITLVLTTRVAHQKHMDENGHQM